MSVEVFRGKSTQYTYDSYTSGYLHTVLADGLKPGSQYYYRVGDGASDWSDTFPFRTMPDQRVPVHYGLLGDLGTTSNSEATVAGMLADDQGLDVLLHVGDLSYANGHQPTWDYYGHMVQSLASRIPWMVAVGKCVVAHARARRRRH